MPSVSSHAACSTEEHQNDKQSDMMDKSESVSDKSRTQKQFADNDKERAFGRDINYRINYLEEQLQSLEQHYRKSELKFRQAIGDISSRTAVVADELLQFNEQMKNGDTENASLISAAEQRIKYALSNLQTTLSGLNSEVGSQYATIRELESNLQSSYEEIDQRFFLLAQDVNAKMAGLHEKQDVQGKTQTIFSDMLDGLNERCNKTADELYSTQIDIAEGRRVQRKAALIAASVMAIAFMAFSGIMGYLHVHESVRVSEQIESKGNFLIDSVKSELDGRYASQEDTGDAVTEIRKNVVNLGKALSDSQATTSHSTQLINETLEGLAERVSALQLSVYGPEDDAGSMVSISVPLLKNDWILQQNPTNHTIQLVGVYRERSMLNFIKQHARALRNHPVAYNISEYRGQNWFNVIYGSFETFQEAQMALDELPESIQENQPWVRKIGAIQKSDALTETY